MDTTIDKVFNWCVSQCGSDPKFIITVFIGLLGIFVSYYYGKHKGMKIIQRQRQTSGNMEQAQYQEVK